MIEFGTDVDNDNDDNDNEFISAYPFYMKLTLRKLYMQKTNTVQ